MVVGVRVFFFSIVKLVFIPQQDLAKFGYRVDIKIKEFKNIFICWLPTEPVIEIWQSKKNL
jgi:hypothetical protein